MTLRAEKRVISLVHIGCGERKVVPILEASKAWKLCIKWDMAGTYWFDLKKNRLLRSENSKVELPWRAEDLERAIETWKVVSTNGVYQPPKEGRRNPFLAKEETNALRNPSVEAVQYAEGIRKSR